MADERGIFNEEGENPKWTEIEHLTEWDEEFYHVYTAKKFGKWVMLKTLAPQYKDDPKYQQMIEQEFDVRYNLAHPNIVMINDLEEVPGVGRSIICDDVYGLSLRTLIDTGKVTQHHIDQLKEQLPSAMQYIQTNHLVHHPIRPETILFTEKIENLKLIDVGFEQRPNLTPLDVTDDIYNYGLVIKETLDKSGINDPARRKVADQCLDPDPKKRFHNVESMRLAIEGHSEVKMYIGIIIVLAVMVAILVSLMLLRKFGILE